MATVITSSCFLLLCFHLLLGHQQNFKAHVFTPVQVNRDSWTAENNSNICQVLSRQSIKPTRSDFQMFCLETKYFLFQVNHALWEATKTISEEQDATRFFQLPLQQLYRCYLYLPLNSTKSQKFNQISERLSKFYNFHQI